MNWVGIIINLAACLWLAWKRGAMDYVSTFGAASAELGALLMKLFILVTILLVISAMFLADALRRFKKSFK